MSLWYDFYETFRAGHPLNFTVQEAAEGEPSVRGVGGGGGMPVGAEGCTSEWGRHVTLTHKAAPPVWRRVVCWSERTSSRQHNKTLVSGTAGAFRRCSDKRLDQFSDVPRTQCQTDTMSLSPGNRTGTAGTTSQVPQPCQACSGNVAAAKQAPQCNQKRRLETCIPPPSRSSANPNPGPCTPNESARARDLVMLAQETHRQTYTVTPPPPRRYLIAMYISLTVVSSPPPLCDIPSGCCFFTGPWTVTRSSLRMLRRVAAFCRPLLVSFPRSRSPVVSVPGLCWMWRDVPFARQRRPVVGVLGLCWLLWGSFDCFCCPHTSGHRPSITCLAVFPCA